MKLAIVAFAVILAIGCAKVPPDLTPEASKAFKGAQVVKALDVLRDTAIAAHAQAPPLLSEDATRKVVTYHQSVVKTLQAMPEGWVAFAQKGLDELLTDLPSRERNLLTPYVTLVKTVIAEVTR